MVQQSIWVCVLRLQDKVSHLVPVHCCVHWVELAIKDISTGVDLFKSLEGTLVELYKLYHKSPLPFVGVVGTRWAAHRECTLRSCLMDGKALMCAHLRWHRAQLSPKIELVNSTLLSLAINSSSLQNLVLTFLLLFNTSAKSCSTTP